LPSVYIAHVDVHHYCLRGLNLCADYDLLLINLRCM